MTGIDPTRPVVLSLGMGQGSVALLTRWLLDPASRGFDLDRLFVLTAMTGDVLSPVIACCCRPV
jgi:hypothetical protein